MRAALGFAWTWTESVSYGRGEPYRFARLFAQAVADEHGIDSGSFARQLLFGPGRRCRDGPTLRRRDRGRSPATRRSPAGRPRRRMCPPTRPRRPPTLVEVADGLPRTRSSTTDGPRVVVLDDVHWIDPSSAGMVELLVATAARRAAGRHRHDAPGSRCRPGPTQPHVERLAARRPRAAGDGAARDDRRPGRARCRRRPADPRADRGQPAVHRRDRAGVHRGRHARAARRPDDAHRDRPAPAAADPARGARRRIDGLDEPAATCSASRRSSGSAFHERDVGRPARVSRSGRPRSTGWSRRR